MLVEARVRKIAHRLLMVLDEAKSAGVPPGAAADTIVRAQARGGEKELVELE